MNIINNIIDSYKHIRYTLLHKQAIWILEKQLDKKHTLRIFLHDLDKIIMYIFLPFLGTITIKKIHKKINKHHDFDNIQNLPDTIIREVILDWESGQYTKTDTTTAKEYCQNKRPEMFIYMNKYFEKWNI